MPPDPSEQMCAARPRQMRGLSGGVRWRIYSGRKQVASHPCRAAILGILQVLEAGQRPVVGAAASRAIHSDSTPSERSGCELKMKKGLSRTTGFDVRTIASNQRFAA